MEKKHSKYTPQTCNSTFGKISCAVKSNIRPLRPIFDLQYCDEEQTRETWITNVSVSKGRGDDDDEDDDADDDLWKPFNVNKLSCHLHAIRTNIQRGFTSNGVQDVKLWGLITITRWTVNKQTNDLSQSTSPSSGVWLWPSSSLLRGNLEIFFGYRVYAFGVGWKLFCLEIRQRPIVCQRASKIWPSWIQW